LSYYIDIYNKQRLQEKKIIMTDELKGAWLHQNNMQFVNGYCTQAVYNKAEKNSLKPVAEPISLTTMN
jgi:hypothetical protein